MLLIQGAFASTSATRRSSAACRRRRGSRNKAKQRTAIRAAKRDRRFGLACSAAARRRTARRLAKGCAEAARTRAAGSVTVAGPWRGLGRRAGLGPRRRRGVREGARGTVVSRVVCVLSRQQSLPQQWSLGPSDAQERARRSEPVSVSVSCLRVSGQGRRDAAGTGEVVVNRRRRRRGAASCFALQGVKVGATFGERGLRKFKVT